MNERYRIGPEDVLEITVWGNPDLSKRVIVRPDGIITLPLIGDIQTLDLKASDIRGIIKEKLERYYKDKPEVTVSVEEANSYYIYVLGEVAQPGKYQVKSYTDVLQAVALAGGFSEWAGKNEMVILRRNLNGHQMKVKARYKDFLRVNGSNGNFTMFPGDTLIVPEK